MLSKDKDHLHIICDNDYEIYDIQINNYFN